MKWIWIRHGKTAENDAGLYVGHYDAPLSEEGIVQAKKLADLLSRESIAHLFSSDLTRTMETARIIGRGHGQSPVPVFALRELSFGSWERKTYDELTVTHKELLWQWYENPLSVAPPGGETLRELGERFDAWVTTQLVQRSPDDTIVCVTHGGPLRWFRSKWLNGDESSFWQTEGVSCGGAFAVEWTGTEWRYV